MKIPKTALFVAVTALSTGCPPEENLVGYPADSGEDEDTDSDADTSATARLGELPTPATPVREER